MPDLDWYKVAEQDELRMGGSRRSPRASSRFASRIFRANGRRWTIAVRIRAARSARAPSRKGVEGQCWIRCPWHGWDFDPLTGASLRAGTRIHGPAALPGGNPRTDGDLTWGLRPNRRPCRAPRRTRWPRPSSNWGVTSRSSAWSATRTSGSRMRCGGARSRWRDALLRHPP